MPWISMAAVGGGAALGAWCRWALGAWLNPYFPSLPLGTLAANLCGGLLIGLALELFSRTTAVPPEFRLMVVTGFLGALTTFSTFSAEVVTALRRADYLWASAAVGLHVLGSLLVTAMGMALVFWLFRVNA
ncbi:putative fluoride ion transporter CrcB [wastewater metagenome]|uniref:Putative fluoride ion transporter CrcB n=2 Tax=unclassified sequences TaxID=12908 RepID=A0A5B8RFP8_9ZZZZ|nr:fluoride efflux transporter CrcB [Arhodomonas sp. KWT]QEA07680.1 putative fluoride ion transporter CrcB [uncultured organism]